MTTNLTLNQHRPSRRRRSNIRPVRGSAVMATVRMPSGQIVFIRSKHRGA